MAVRLWALGVGRALNPEIFSDIHFCQRLSQPQGQSTAGSIRQIERIKWPQQDSNPRLFGLHHNSSNDYATVCPHLIPIIETN
jgi:hypothetical protein